MNLIGMSNRYPVVAPVTRIVALICLIEVVVLDFPARVVEEPNLSNKKSLVLSSIEAITLKVKYVPRGPAIVCSPVFVLVLVFSAT